MRVVVWHHTHIVSAALPAVYGTWSLQAGNVCTKKRAADIGLRPTVCLVGRLIQGRAIGPRWGAASYDILDTAPNKSNVLTSLNQWFLVSSVIISLVRSAFTAHLKPRRTHPISFERKRRIGEPRMQMPMKTGLRLSWAQFRFSTVDSHHAERLSRISKSNCCLFWFDVASNLYH